MNSIAKIIIQATRMFISRHRNIKSNTEFQYHIWLGFTLVKLTPTSSGFSRASSRLNSIHISLVEYVIIIISSSTDLPLNKKLLGKNIEIDPIKYVIGIIK